MCSRMNAKRSGSPESRYAWYVAIILMLTMMVAAVDRAMMAVLVEPIKADLGINDTQIGFIQGMSFGVFYTVMSLPLGYLIDTRNRTRILAICIGAWSVFTALGGIARNFLEIFLARVGVGVGECVLGPASLSLLSDYFPKEKVAKPFGLAIAGMYFGFGLAIYLGGVLQSVFEDVQHFTLPLVGEPEPWRLIFIIVSVPGIFLAILVLMSIKEPIRCDSKRIARGKQREVDSGAVRRLISFIKTHSTLLVALYAGAACAAFMVAALQSWLPVFFLRTFSWSPAQTGQFLGPTLAGFGICGALLAGFVESIVRERGYSDAKLRTCVLCLVGFVCLTIFGLLIPLPYLSLLLLGVSFFCITIPTVLGPTVIAEIAPSELRGQLVALYMLSLGLLGLSLGPIVVGFLTDYVFGNPKLLNYSLATATILIGPLSFLLYWRAAVIYRSNLP